MRRFLPLALTALLFGGCDYDLQSEAPVIPESELAMPEGLSGKYWLVADGASSLMVMEWKANQQDRTWLIDPENQGTISRLVDLTGGTDFLWIVGDKGELATYFLMQRLDHGVVEVGQLHIDGSSPFSPQNLEYARRVAKRHDSRLKHQAKAGS